MDINFKIIKYNATFRYTSALSMQNINSCLVFDVVKHQQRLEYIP